MKRIAFVAFITILPLLGQASEKSDQLERQIQDLVLEIKQEERAAYNLEQDAQKLLPVRWEEYAQTMKQIDSHRDKIVELQGRLGKLEKQLAHEPH